MQKGEKSLAKNMIVREGFTREKRCTEKDLTSPNQKNLAGFNI